MPKKDKRPRLDIVKFVPRDIVKEWIQPQEGNLYFYRHGAEFIVIQSINGEDAIVIKTYNGKTWSDPEKKGLSEIKDHYKKVLLEEGETALEAILSLRAELSEKLLQDDAPDYVEDEDDDSEEEDEERKADTITTAVVARGGIEIYEREAYALMRIQSRINALAAMAEKRAERVRREIYAIEKRLRKVMRVLGMLETYLGKYEEIFQITEGAPAPTEMPIGIRQLILYMDEEAGLVDVFDGRTQTRYFGNINFQNVKLFDHWLLEDNHLDIVLPELKGVVALRPSRNRQQYEDEDKWSAEEKKAADSMIYLLIRNGENLYRIWTSIQMDETLFPTYQDAQELAGAFAKADHEWDREKAEKEQATWLTNTLLLQGLFDRTDLFQPMPVGRVDLSMPETFEPGGRVRLIRDAERVLTDGHLSFEAWRDLLNQNVKRGTRIYLSQINGSRHDTSGRHRFTVYQNYYPDYPKRGLYTVEEIVKGAYYTQVRIIYKPTDTVYSRPSEEWDAPRKRGYSFLLYYDEILNYDDLEVPDIEYYLQSRLDRPSYYTMMPLLISLRKIRKEELVQEKAFIRLVSEREGLQVKQITRLVDWWKMKVINKRPLSKDDAKAWRMIIKEARLEIKRSRQ